MIDHNKIKAFSDEKRIAETDIDRILISLWTGVKNTRARRAIEKSGCVDLLANWSTTKKNPDLKWKFLGAIGFGRDGRKTGNLAINPLYRYYRPIDRVLRTDRVDNFIRGPHRNDSIRNNVSTLINVLSLRLLAEVGSRLAPPPIN